MKNKKVFIASSNDVVKEREKLEKLLKEIRLEPVLWENEDQAITSKSFQDFLDENGLKQSEIVIFLIKSKIGEYTKHEFELAYKELGRIIKKIYIYFIN